MPSTDVKAIWMTRKSADFCVEALDVYSRYLHVHHRTGNETIEKELEGVERAIRSLQNQTRSNDNRFGEIFKEGHDPEGYEFDPSTLSYLVATFPLLLRKFENEKHTRIKEGSPVEATEDLVTKCEEVKAIMNYNLFNNIEPHTLIGDNHLMEEKEEDTSPGHTINNYGDGIVTIGDRNYIVQQKFQNVSEILIKFAELVKEDNTLTQDQQLEIESELDTIQAQLKKPKPNQSVLKSAFGAIKNVVATGEFIHLLMEAAKILGVPLPL